MKQIAAVVNEVLQAENITAKINIDLWVELPGGHARTANLTNYSDKTHYDSLQDLHMGSGVYGSIYADPSTYINLPDIRSLTIHADIQRQAETQGIDWYEIWPSLETVDVYD